MKDIKGDLASHSSWAHYKGKPMTEADLPRGIDDGSSLRDERMKGKNEVFEAQKAAERVSRLQSQLSEEIPEAA